MTILETINFWQMIFTGITALAAIIAAILAYRIGRRQIEITSFVELFLMPLYQEIRDQNGKLQNIKWSVLIKNASSYPIYINSFNLNGVKHEIGSSAIPCNPDSWYGIPIPQDVQDKKEFSLLVEFEDYLGKKYKIEGFGIFDGVSWNIKSKKRIEVEN